MGQTEAGGENVPTHEADNLRFVGWGLNPCVEASVGQT